MYIEYYTKFQFQFSIFYWGHRWPFITDIKDSAYNTVLVDVY